MADGRDEFPAYPARKGYLGAEIFRCFQVALDPRKLLLAAAGILAMSLGWYVLSAVFHYDEPKRTSPEYSNDAMNKANDGKGLKEEELKALADTAFQRDYQRWLLLADLAGPSTATDDDRTIPGGRLRTLPWDEYRGDNPYLLFSGLATGNAAERSGKISNFFSATVPVLVEPLLKLLLPVFKFMDPDASPWTRIYLMLCLVWSLAVWAFAGGVITRIAAVQLTGKDRVTLNEAVQFVVNRYLSYVLSPLVPLGIITIIVFVLSLYGFVAMFWVFGDIVLYGLGMPLVLLGGVVMAILLVGLVGYPMMYTTISTEGSDTFDALSRSYNYVFQAPWTYLWYSVLAVAYGAALTLLVMFVGSLSVYAAKWSIGQAPLNEATNKKPDYLFVYAPKSFGWQELFLRNTPLEKKEILSTNAAGALRASYVYADAKKADDYLKTVTWFEKTGAGMVSFWLTLVFLMMLGFSYSYFWSASTAIYLLMRNKVDETEIDELYIEEPLPETPLTPPAAPTTPTSAPSVPLVTVPPPVPVSPPIPVSPPAPAPVPMVEPVPPPIPVVEKPTDPTATDGDAK
ncbi:MAG: hypothetical protein ACRC7O_10005 [Fimbriiglobus sp.]